MTKKIIAALLVIIIAMPYFAINISAASDTVIIHYHRDDGEYDQWNIWGWPEGGDGVAYQFDSEDSFGKIANITLPIAKDKVGFIVRTDSWEKDFGDDRFIDTTLGTEIWIFSGQGEFSYEPPEGYESAIAVFDEINVKLRYHRYDGDYSGVAVKFMVDGVETEEIPFKNGELSATIGYSRSIDFAIYKDGVINDYEGGKFSTGKTDESGNLEVYLMQGTGKAAFSSENFKTEKNISRAEIISNKDINVKLSMPVKLDESALQGFTLSDGGAVEIASVTPATGGNVDFVTVEDGYAVDFTITTVGDIDFSSKYTVSKEGFGAANVVLGNVFDSDSFAALYTYTGDDLGAVYSADSTSFRVWSPTASSVNLLVYADGEVKEGDTPLEAIAMTKDANGTWAVKAEGDYKNKYYVYEVEIDGVKNLGVDPYAKAVGVNGLRAMIVDLPSTDPAGFRTHTVPEFKNQTDAVIYELHVRDLSMNNNSGIQAKGKFAGLIETGTKNDAGLSTGIDHIVELGATHVHLLPSFDYKTIDETKLEENKFNWGYDPQNYNVPEGSYSTDPYNGNIRVKEYKEMVQGLHENGLRVIMDVVYNHTYTVNDSNLNMIVPYYYYRTDDNGNFTNGSGCGNETASERLMVRKLIVDSVVYWAKEYRVDGFRFDLMGLHDIETMNAVRAALNEIDPSIIVYGEGWTAGGSPLPAEDSAIKANTPKLDKNIAAFSDDIRDGIKGSVFNAREAGFVNAGKKSVAGSRDEDIKFGIVASVEHPQVNIGAVSYSDNFWATAPTQTVTYASAHDNLSLWDKLIETDKLASDEDLVRMNKLSAAIVLTSQGIPFFQAGEEIARTKKGNENSYQSPDSINQIDWDNKTKYNDLFEYYKGLIALRKKYTAFRLTTADEIRSNISFIETEASVVAYTLANTEGSGYPSFAVIFNGSHDEKTVNIDGSWEILVNEATAGVESLGNVGGGTIQIPAKAAMVLGQVEEEVSVPQEAVETKEAQAEVEPDTVETSSPNIAMIGAGIAAAVIAVVGGVVFWIKRKKS